MGLLVLDLEESFSQKRTHSLISCTHSVWSYGTLTHSRTSPGQTQSSSGKRSTNSFVLAGALLTQAILEKLEHRFDVSSGLPARTATLGLWLSNHPCHYVWDIYNAIPSTFFGPGYGEITWSEEPIESLVIWLSISGEFKSLWGHINWNMSLDEWRGIWEPIQVYYSLQMMTASAD